jgi:hypothetical protein
MQRGKQMTVLRDWCTSPSATANPPFQSQQAQLESGVRGNVPAPFGAGERLQGPTYRYHGETYRKATRPVPTQ